jgi:hypothetical protein
MPAMVTWDSAARHLANWLEGRQTLTSEDHLAAIGWNIMCTMHTIEMVNREILTSDMFVPPNYIMDMSRNVDMFEEDEEQNDGTN